MSKLTGVELYEIFKRGVAADDGALLSWSELSQHQRDGWLAVAAAVGPGNSSWAPDAESSAAAAAPGDSAITGKPITGC